MTELTSATSDPLQALLDERDLRELLARYADAVDALDDDALAGVFAPDVRADLLGTTLEGRDAVVTHVITSLSAFSATNHLVGNERIRVDGDTATMRAAVHAFHRHARTGAVWDVFGRYEVGVERHPDGWAITRFTLHGIDGEPRSSRTDRLYRGHPERRART